MKKLLLFTFITLTTFVFSAQAEDTHTQTDQSTKPAFCDVSGMVSLQTDYISKGMTQVREGGQVLQASLECAHRSGIYVGHWASTVNFGEATTEHDPYVGYRKQVTEDLTLDAQVFPTLYPGVDDNLDYDFWTFRARAFYQAHEKLQVIASLDHSEDFFGGTGRMDYPQVMLVVPITENLSFTPSAGYLFVEDNQKFGLPDFANGSIGFRYTLPQSKGTSLAVQATSTSLSDSKSPNKGEPELQFSLTHTF